MLKEQRLISKDLEQQNGSIAGGLQQTVAPPPSSSGNLHDLPYKDAPRSDVRIMQSPCCSAQAQLAYFHNVVMQNCSKLLIKDALLYHGQPPANPPPIWSATGA